MKRITLIIALLVLFVHSGCRASTERGASARPAVAAGQFYPSDPEELKLAISRYLEEAIAPRTGKPIAIVVPHAGYVYSGQIAADAFRQAAAHPYDVVVILGTNHTTTDFSGVSIYAQGGFETPFGIARVDEALSKELLKADPRFTSDPRVHEKEHSVEVEVPFVQQVFPNVPIVPIIIGEPDLDLCTRLGKALAAALQNRDGLIVASSDLSHYPTHDDANRVDRETLKAIACLDPVKVRSTVRGQLPQRVAKLATCACGEAPILAAMVAATTLGANHGAIISYANSGDAAVGDYDRVVGYGAAVFSHGVAAVDTLVLTSHDRPLAAIEKDLGELSSADRRTLLSHARKTIEWYVTSRTTPLPRGMGDATSVPAGAFVTLKKHGELRGCIGHMAEDLPLCQTVGNMALMAAFEDRRFRPVEEKELDELEVEISVLTPAQSIPDASHIVVGRDGVILRKGGQSAVFLPQVATEQGWTRDEMLDQLCLKAGLPVGSWKQNTEFRTFQAIVFSEKEP